MKTLVSFKSNQFPSFGSEVEGSNFDNGVYGKRLADYLCEKLAKQGFQITDCFAEDWGWMVAIKHDRKFPLFIGCGHSDDADDSYLCFVEPDGPVIRNSFKTIDVRDTVTDLKTALKKIIEADPLIHSIEWD